MSRFILALAIISLLVYGGWTYWQANSTQGAFVSKSSFKVSDQSLDNVQSVLGASIESGVGTVNSWLSSVTDGASEPIINNAINNFQNELKKLPEDQVKKIQYNYCKSIVEEYEKQ